MARNAAKQQLQKYINRMPPSDKSAKRLLDLMLAELDVMQASIDAGGGGGGFELIEAQTAADEWNGSTAIDGTNRAGFLFSGLQALDYNIYRLEAEIFYDSAGTTMPAGEMEINVDFDETTANPSGLSGNVDRIEMNRITDAGVLSRVTSMPDLLSTNGLWLMKIAAELQVRPMVYGTNYKDLYGSMRVDAYTYGPETYEQIDGVIAGSYAESATATYNEKLDNLVFWLGLKADGSSFTTAPFNHCDVRLYGKQG